jgi:hypothetical protein
MLRRVSIAVAIVAVLAVGLSGLALWLKLLLGVAVALATWRSVRRLVAVPVAAAGWSADNDWTLRLIDYKDVPATLASFRVFGVFVLLRLQTVEHGAQVLLLAPDNSDADIRRRLRMRLATMQPDSAAPRL